MKNENKVQIRVSKEVWRELMMRKIDGGYRSIDEVLRDLLNIPQKQKGKR